MTRALIVLAICTMTGIPDAAVAEQWVPVAKAGFETVFIDMESGEHADGHVRYRDKVVYRDGRQIGVYGIAATDEPGRRVSFTEMHRHYDLDCVNREIVTLSVSYYDSDGTLVSRMADRFTPIRIAPGSLADVTADLMCPVLP